MTDYERFKAEVLAKYQRELPDVDALVERFRAHCEAEKSKGGSDD